MSKSKSRKQTQGSPATAARKREEKAKRRERRRRKRLFLTAAAVVLVIAAGGSALYTFGRGEAEVQNLAAVGAGVPAVVQVHDTTCPVCTELRGNVDRIAGDYSEEDLLIRVADVHSDDGLSFAARYTAARRATLLFIDGDGELVDERSGALEPSDLRMLFDRHISGEL